MELDYLYFVYLDARANSDLMQAIIPLIRQTWSLDSD
jgi:hypothetical protein